MPHLSSPVMLHSPYELAEKVTHFNSPQISEVVLQPSIIVPGWGTTSELGFQNLSKFLPTLNHDPSGCESSFQYHRVLMSLLSWGGQQQILINEDLYKATVEPQLQIKRGSFEVPFHSNEGSFPRAAECSIPACTGSWNGPLFVPTLLKQCHYSRGAGPSPRLHYVSMGNKWLRSMTAAAQQLIFQDVRQYV